MIGMTEMLVILAVVFLLFGAKRLPGLGKALGESMSNFKKALKDGNTRDVEEIGDEEKNKKS